MYYFSYFLIPALTGKLFGWSAANMVLFLWTVLGIALCFVFLLCYFDTKTIEKVLAIILIFFFIWRGFDELRGALSGLLNSYWNYEYTNNNALLEWVTNQTVVPWLATLILIGERRIKNYAILGMLVLGSAPLPFAGIFILMAFSGIFQFGKEYGKKLRPWIKDVLSIQNIIAVSTVFPVFALFYSANMAANGSNGAGGIGFWGEISVHGAISLMLFWVCYVLIYVALIYKDHKRDSMFWVVTVSLLVIPVIKLGGDRDFCMRASIPALCFMMVYVMEYLFTHYKDGTSIRCIILICTFGLFFENFTIDWIHKTTTVIHAESREDYQADAVHTLANRLPYTQTYGSAMNMYLTDDPYETVFFSKLCRKKPESDVAKDLSVTEGFLKDEGFDIVSGTYIMSCPSVESDGKEYGIVISNTTIPGKCEIDFSDTNELLTINDAKEVERGGQGTPGTPWGTNDTPVNQLFTIEAVGQYYKIIWNDEYALVYIGDDLVFEELSDEAQQLWSII